MGLSKASLGETQCNGKLNPVLLQREILSTARKLDPTRPINFFGAQKVQCSDLIGAQTI